MELNPKTAKTLGLADGDGVTVSSPHGRITAHVAYNPGLDPGTAAMPMGQGHTRYGRIAAGRGENPFLSSRDAPRRERAATDGSTLVAWKRRSSPPGWTGSRTRRAVEPGNLM